MALRGFVKNYEIDLEIGVDTGREILCADRMKGIKPISSDEIEAVRSELNQCDENSKTIILDALSGITK